MQLCLQIVDDASDGIMQLPGKLGHCQQYAGCETLQERSDQTVRGPRRQSSKLLQRVIKEHDTMHIISNEECVDLGEGLIYYTPLKTLICKTHGNAIHHGETAVKRHLRGNGHRSRGQILVKVLHKLKGLQLADVEEIHRLRSTRPDQQPVPHIKIHDGWVCTSCDDFLTTSLEIVQRHAGSSHGRERLGESTWETVRLQTLFSETKDRRYFVVEPVVVKKYVTMKTPRTTALSLINTHTTISLKHPFTEVAERWAPLSPSRINYLLKSPAFRCASMPIFSDTLSDMDLQMKSVFPECEESPVWIAALLYSTVQILNRGTVTTESLQLQRMTIRYMNEKLALTTAFCTAAVGAIMMLKATAYKLGDTVGLEIHTKGLKQILKYIEKTDLKLSPAAMDALFWVNLGAAAYSESDQATMIDVEAIPELPWAVEQPRIFLIPKGFQRHQDWVSQSLLECVANLTEFQGALNKTNHEKLGAMQASIELQLLRQAQDYNDNGLAELIRLALYICTYCSWFSTWKCSLLPSRLSYKMIVLFEQYEGELTAYTMSEHIDLLFWLLFTCSIAADLDEGYVDLIRSQRDATLLKYGEILAPNDYNNEYKVMMSDALSRGLQDYVYVAGWVDQRHQVPAWHMFEQRVSGDELRISS